jgi:opacity protein-like surface antigen
MTTGLFRAIWVVIIVPLAGCTFLPDAYSGCNDVKPYESAKGRAPLQVPAGADMPDTRNALKIPDVNSPELPVEAGTCLDHPPAIGGGGSLAGTGAAAPSAAGAAGAAEPPAAARPTDFAMDESRPWQTRLGVNYQPTTRIDFDGGSKVEFNSSTGFLVGLGYDLSSHLQVGANFTYDERDYDASLAGDDPGETFPARGSLKSMGVMADLSYYFMTGRFTPFVTTGIGWNFVDTNIPTSPPQVGCWWNPWYGYICQGFQETKSVDGFAYQLGAGLRYRLNPSLSLNGSYRMSWLDFPKADGTPSFEGFQFILNWGF